MKILVCCGYSSVNSRLVWPEFCFLHSVRWPTIPLHTKHLTCPPGLFCLAPVIWRLKLGWCHGPGVGTVAMLESCVKGTQTTQLSVMRGHISALSVCSLPELRAWCSPMPHTVVSTASNQQVWQVSQVWPQDSPAGRFWIRICQTKSIANELGRRNTHWGLNALCVDFPPLWLLHWSWQNFGKDHSVSAVFENIFKFCRTSVAGHQPSQVCLPCTTQNPLQKYLTCLWSVYLKGLSCYIWTEAYIWYQWQKCWPVYLKSNLNLRPL